MRCFTTPILLLSATIASCIGHSDNEGFCSAVLPTYPKVDTSEDITSVMLCECEESHTSKQSIVVCQYNVGTSDSYIALRTGSCDAYICSIVQSCSQPADFDTSELDVNNFDMYVFERWCVGYNGSESPAVSSPSGSAPTLSPKEESSDNSLESKLTSSPTLQTLPLSGDTSASCAMMQSVWLGVVLLASTAAIVV